MKDPDVEKMVKEEFGEPIFGFGEHDHVIGIWFMAVDGVMDFMGVLWYPKDAEKGRGVYRFRHYDLDDPGNDAFSGKDRKSVYQLSFPREDEEQVIAAMDSISGLAQMVYDKVDLYERAIIQDTGRAAGEWILKQPWCHVKTVSKTHESIQ